MKFYTTHTHTHTPHTHTFEREGSVTQDVNIVYENPMNASNILIMIFNMT